MCRTNLFYMIVVLAKMFQASKSKLNGQLQGQGLNKNKQWEEV